MLNKYHVIYITSRGKKTFRVLANNKQEAYNIFKKVVGNYVVLDIVDYTKVLTQKKHMRKLITYSLICLTIVVAMIVSALIMNRTWEHPEPSHYITYVVEQGDCLWSIADNSNGWNKLDNRKIIEDLCNKSNCTSMVYPGQTVYIPIYDID